MPSRRRSIARRCRVSGGIATLDAVAERSPRRDRGPRIAEPERAESSEAPRALAPKVKAPPRRALLGINATEDEAKLLERARAALATQPSLAFALTEEHSRRFARGALREEREVVAIEALRKLGKKHIAAQRAARFEQRYPGSVHLEKIRGRR